jgi:hypothetical protein
MRITMTYLLVQQTARIRLAISTQNIGIPRPLLEAHGIVWTPPAPLATFVARRAARVRDPKGGIPPPAARLFPGAHGEMGPSSETEVAGASGPSLRVRENRAGFEVVRRVADLSARDLRLHLGTDLRELPLDEPGREFVRWFLGGFVLPDDERFWQLLALAEAHTGPPEQWLTKAIETEELVVPDGWRDAAKCVLRLCAMLRTNASLAVTAWSERFRRGWEQGNGTDLIAMICHDGVRHQWVCDAITALRAQQLTGAADERQRATTLLTQVGDALRYLGKGKTATRDADDDRRAGQATRRRSRALRRLLDRVAKWNPILGRAGAIEEAQHEFETNSKIAPPDREAILSAFLERVASDSAGLPEK